MAPTGARGYRRARVAYVALSLALVTALLSFTREARYVGSTIQRHAPGSTQKVFRAATDLAHTIKDLTLGDDDDGAIERPGGVDADVRDEEDEIEETSGSGGAIDADGTEPAGGDKGDERSRSSDAGTEPAEPSKVGEAADAETSPRMDGDAAADSIDSIDRTGGVDPGRTTVVVDDAAVGRAPPAPPPEPEPLRALSPMRCGRRLALTPHVKIDVAEKQTCEVRPGHADAPLWSVVAAIDAAAVPSVHWPGIVQLMRESMGRPETAADERVHAEIVLAVFGAFDPSMNEGVAAVKEALSGENDFLLLLPSGGADAVGRDAAIARALRVSRATLTLVAGDAASAIVPPPPPASSLTALSSSISGAFGSEKRAAYFLPPVEWTTAALAVLAPAPYVAAVTMGKGAKGDRPTLVRRWEAAVVAGQEGSGCATANRGGKEGSDRPGGALVAAVRRLAETAAVELDASERLNHAPEALEFLAGKWEMASHREQGGQNAKETTCRISKKPNRRKTCNDAGGADVAFASVVIQYFRRKENIAPILSSLRQTSTAAEAPVELLVNVDSGFDAGERWLEHVAEWRGAPGTPPAVLLFSNDIHELRAYNRLAAAAVAEMLVFAQDDDAPAPGSHWLETALWLFRTHHSLALLGGYRGRMDDGLRMKTSSNQNDGSKFGAEYEKDRETRPIVHIDTSLGVPFSWMYKVNMGPLIMRRSHFLSSGGFHLGFSCPGQMAQGFDYEMSVRVWREGLRVGLYDPNWTHRIDQHAGQELGNKQRHRDIQKAEATAAKDAATRRNNQLLYSAYRGFHHAKGTKAAKRALERDVENGRLKCVVDGHPVCGNAFLGTPWRGSEVCLDVSCFRDQYLRDQGLPDNYTLTKVEKVKQRWEWKESEAALEVWNGAVMEARAVAVKAARGAGSGELGRGDARAVEDALALWAEAAGLDDKVSAARLAVVKDAEAPMRRAEQQAKAGFVYGSGGGNAAGCGDCVKEKANAARLAASMMKTGEAQSLAKEAIHKAGYTAHASEVEAREKAMSAQAFEEGGDGKA